ncbi:papain-family cysteine protease, putative [Theileria annulata]|uniref:Papain-family cysteine protease, putative n=1 Tax=Theileria annulata TaxID=5874 RepID=Q4U985_THEAN|nr:papain-family cysteine protease, putative [Theileria annulata]CAI76618.1 papain-family cysteine protease, putative [Theileria annulata]|eukprot:XP_953243.1 papain-family cysteine protease, putative [Theileria annulata]
MKVLLILANLVLIQGYKRNFNINLALVDDNGNIQINDVKLLNDTNVQNPPTNRVNANHPGYENNHNSQQNNEVYPQYNARNDNLQHQRAPLNPQHTQPTNTRPPQPYNNRNTKTCVMNNINCALSGANGKKLEHCLSCANTIYSPTDCNKYEPLSLISLFSKNTYAGGGNSLLELESEATDLTLEGLKPLNIKPKVSVHELLYSYDKNHLNTRDPYCNDYECMRLKDRNSCISRLYPQNQYGCGSCWIFANTLHLEILLCMESATKQIRRFSEMYIASCLSVNNRDPCKGGNTYDFSQIISQFEFIPSKDNVKYNVPVLNTCPRWDYSWINQKPKIELLSPKNNKLNSFKGFILIKREEYDDKNEFINLVKDMIKEKGSVVISMKGKSVLKPDHDGKKVLNLCHHGYGTHSMVIIGYGNYVNEYNETRRYWLIRNSWGPNWGDNGNFRLDIDGPGNCNGNIFEYAGNRYTKYYLLVVLNVKINKNTNKVKYGYVPQKLSKLSNGVTKKINVKYNNKVYSRLIFQEGKGLFLKFIIGQTSPELDCNRAFSINRDRNDECVEKCKRNLEMCKSYNVKDIGLCLFSIDKDYDCMMCGV